MSRPQPDHAASPSRDEVMATMAQWRTEHPRATLAEIERAVDQHLSAYRAEVIRAVAADASDDRPVCPDCATTLVRVGTRSRRLRTAQGGEVAFTEPAWRCPACGVGLFPPD